MIPNDERDVGFGVVYAQTTNLVGDEHFVWFDLKRKPKRAELRELKRAAKRAAGEAHVFANVDSTNQTNMRFAQAMGFEEVRRVGDVAVMVLGVY